MKSPLLLTLLLALTGLGASAADRPNIVWIVSEDNGATHLRLYNPQGAPTPHIESLAAEGITFDHAFSNAPVCSVARSTLISSSYGPRIGTQFHRRSALVPLPQNHRMFPAYLRDAGYYTSNNSKEDYNAFKAPDVWDESSGKASYRNRKKGQSFFHVQNFGTTHEGQLFFTAEQMANEPTKIDPATVRVPDYLPDTPLFRYTVARYLDLQMKMDAEVGEFIAQLEADGVLDNTIIFYYGDHGGIMPRSKGYAYETGLHVPLVIRTPAKWQKLVHKQPGTRDDTFVSFVDFGATVLNLAGVDVPDAFDGRPFLGRGVHTLLLAERDEVFGYADRFDEKTDFVRTLRRGNFKYMRNYTPFTVDMLHNNYRYRQLAYREWRRLYRADELTPEQAQFFEPRAPEALYDISKDPDEINNLADDPAYRDVLNNLRWRLTTRLKGMPDLSFYPESILTTTAWQNPTQFGQDHQAEIARLIDIANLAVMPFAKAQPKIAAALASTNPWERYWGLIVCSSFAEEASDFYVRASHLAKTDDTTHVRVRAAEFLGITKAANPVPLLQHELAESTDSVETMLILNTVVLLQDHFGYKFKINDRTIGKPYREIDNRLQHLNP
ncbi:MAG: sulfatase [Synoicihabitans sp.]